MLGRFHRLSMFFLAARDGWGLLRSLDVGAVAIPTVGANGGAGICSPAILGTYQPLKEVEYLQPDMEAWIDSMVVDSPPVSP